MKKTTKMTPLEIAERFLRISALGLFLVGVGYGADAIKMLFDGTTNEVIEYISMVAGFSVLILVFPAFLQFVALRARGKIGACDPEGFILDEFRQAGFMGFQFGFLFTLFSEMALTEILPDMSPTFFLKLSVAVMLFGFSLTFFHRVGIWNKRDEDESVEA